MGINLRPNSTWHQNHSLKKKTASPLAPIGYRKCGLAVLNNLAVEKSVALGLCHPILNHQIMTALKH